MTRRERRRADAQTALGMLLGFVVGCLATAMVAEAVAREAIGDRFLDCDSYDCGEDH